MEGTVKWFNRKKGFGFIQGEDGQDYFVHHSTLAQGTFIRDDDKVSFDAADTDKGKQAQNVVLLQKGSERTDLPPKEEAKEEPEEAKEEPEEAKEEPEEAKEQEPEEAKEQEPEEKQE